MRIVPRHVNIHKALYVVSKGTLNARILCIATTEKIPYYNNHNQQFNCQIVLCLHDYISRYNYLLSALNSTAYQSIRQEKTLSNIMYRSISFPHLYQSIHNIILHVYSLKLLMHYVSYNVQDADVGDFLPCIHNIK